MMIGFGGFVSQGIGKLVYVVGCMVLGASGCFEPCGPSSTPPNFVNMKSMTVVGSQS